MRVWGVPHDPERVLSERMPVSAGGCCLVEKASPGCCCLALSAQEPAGSPLKPVSPLCSPLPCRFSSSAVVDADGRIYIRNWQGGILSGGFERNPKPIFTEGKNQLEIQNLQEDWDHFGV